MADSSDSDPAQGEALSHVERAEAFQRALHDLTRENRGSIASRGESDAVIVRGKAVRHRIHGLALAGLAILAVIEGIGLGLVPLNYAVVAPLVYAAFWLFLALTGGVERDHITMDDKGNLRRSRSGRLVETQLDFLRIALPIVVIAVTAPLAAWLTSMILFPPFPMCNLGDPYALPAGCFTFPNLLGGSQGAPLSVDQTRAMEGVLRAIVLAYMLVLLLPAVWFLRSMLTGRSVGFVRPIRSPQQYPANSGLVAGMKDEIARAPNRTAALARAAGAGVATIAIAVVVFELTIGHAWLQPSPAPTETPRPQETFRPDPTINLVESGIDDSGDLLAGGIWVRRGSTLGVSVDSGASWTTLSMAAALHGNDRVLAVSVLDAITAIAVVGLSSAEGWQTSVVATADAGATWSDSVIAPGLPAGTPTLCFADARNGFLALPDSASSEPSSSSQTTPMVLVTHTGGRGWERTARLPISPALIGATDPNTLWAGPNGPSSSEDSNPPTLSVSRNGGSSWSSVNLKIAGGQDLTHSKPLLRAPRFWTSSSGVAVVLDNTNLHYQVAFLITNDAGSTWSEVASPQATGQDAAEVLDQNHWFVAASGRRLLMYSTMNGGASWNDLATTGLGDDWVVQWIHFADPSHGSIRVRLGQAQTSASALMLTSDGGLTWRPASFGSSFPS
jgi:photosystem II stability/assembly factor-like uncharacterized protein